MVAKGPSGSGLRPQVEGFATANAVGFGSSSYRITHPVTGLTLDHDSVAPVRRHISQQELIQEETATRRLQDGALSPIRRSRRQTARKQSLTHPQLDLSSIIRRIP